MTANSTTIPKLSERFSDLFGVEGGGRDNVVLSIFLEESRKLALNKLLHLVPYSEVLLLLGEQGVGKTTLLNAFAVRRAKTWKLAFVTGTALMSGRDFLRHLAEDFELNTEPEAGSDILQSELERYIQALGRTGRRAIIVMDDVHALTDDVLHQAERLLRAVEGEGGLSLVLAMRKEYEAKINQFALLRGKLAYTLRLNPLTKKELPAYVRYRLADTTVNIEQIFTPEIINRLHQQSCGLPEAVNESLHALLVEQQVAPKAGGGAKRMVQGGLATVIGALVVAVLYFQDEINNLFEEDAPVPAVAEAPEVKPLILDAPRPKPDVSPPVTEASEILPPEVMAEIPVVPAVSEDEVPPFESEQALEVVVSEIEDAPEAIVEPVVQQVEAEDQIQETPAIPLVTEEIPPPKQEVEDPEIAWIKAQPDGNYTMQLMALIDQSKVFEFVAKHGIDDASATYLKVRTGDELTVLIYGSFSDYESAKKAASELPKSWRVGEPWIRTFGGVKKEIKAL